MHEERAEAERTVNLHSVFTSLLIILPMLAFWLGTAEHELAGKKEEAHASLPSNKQAGKLSEGQWKREGAIKSVTWKRIALQKYSSLKLYVLQSIHSLTSVVQ